MLLAFVHMSSSSKLMFSCVHFFTATFKLEQIASLHQGKDAPCSGATKGTIPSCLLVFSKKNSKKSNKFVEIDRTSERFFNGNSNSRKVNDDSSHGMTSCYSFKAPSANTPGAMARRLASTSLVSSFHPISFQERSSDRWDSGPKRWFHEQNPA
jgi:hypothetical protein